MLVGAHVSPAGGPARAVDRGAERGAAAIQFFNQSPRAWRAREYTDDEAAEFRETLAASSVEAALIHTVYLINCASQDRTIRRKSLRTLTIALRSGAALGVEGVVLHAGSALAGDVEARDHPGGQGHPRRAGRLGGLPAAPGGHGGLRRDARALVLRTGGADRGRGRG